MLCLLVRLDAMRRRTIPGAAKLSFGNVMRYVRPTLDARLETLRSVFTHTLALVLQHAISS